MRFLSSLLRGLRGAPGPAANHAPRAEPHLPQPEPAPPPCGPAALTVAELTRCYAGAREAAEAPRVRDLVREEIAANRWISARGRLQKMFTSAIRRELTPLGFSPDTSLNQALEAASSGRSRGDYISRRGRRYVDFHGGHGIRFGYGFVMRHDGLNRRIPQVEGLWEDLAPQLRIHTAAWHPTLSFGLEELVPGLTEAPDWNEVYHGMMAIPTAAGVKEYVQRYVRLLRAHLLPEMERLLDLRAVCDRVLAEFPFQPGVQGFLGSDGASIRRLILARLADDARYEALYDYEMSKEADWMRAAQETPTMPQLASYPQVFREVHKRLKAVAPLASPVLD